MRFRDIIICFLCVILGLGLLVTASSRLDSIRTARKEMGLVSNAPLENAPPALAFATVAMGAFRGLVVDILWIRADKLKEEGQFFDAKQLAEWITVLQPRFASVWDFQAWNMAYNISVAMPASQWQERWRWVRNGYELLRDKGIEQNPHSILLYRSLAWIFQHKIGEVSDDCHKHYKRELALSMRKLLGERPDNERFEALAKAPLSFSEILAEPGVAEFVEALKSVDKAFKDNDDFIGSYLALRQNPDKFKPETFAVIDQFRSSPALEKFDTFAKAYELRNTWKLQPKRMIKLNKSYGPSAGLDSDETLPINWEHPNTHAIYWAQLGLDVAGDKGKYSVDEKNTDRIVFHSLQSLFRRGKIIIYPIPGEISSVYLRPDLEMFDPASRAWVDRIEKYEALQKSNPKAVRNGYKNFLINAVASFYQAGRIKKANQIYKELRKCFDHEDFQVPLKTFVRKRMTEELRDITIKDATELILFSLREAYFQYALHEDDLAAGNEAWAKEVYNIYQKQFGEETVRRVDLPGFEMLRYLGLVSFVNDRYYPEYLRNSLFGRIELEKPELLEKLKKQAEIFEQEVQKAQQAAPNN